MFMNHKKEKIGSVIDYINAYMSKNKDAKYEIYVGCDSQVNTNRTMYSVVIGIHTIIDGIGRGVHIIHTREIDKKFGNSKGEIFTRLWKEVDKIVETALFLKDNGIDTKDIGTHVDANANERYASNMIYSSAIGYLNSLGFNVEGKPNAWAATYAAGKYASG